jgi:hypothetical protein
MDVNGHPKDSGQPDTLLHSNANDPTADEKAALAGAGTPNVNNPYKTLTYDEATRDDNGGTVAVLITDQNVFLTLAGAQTVNLPDISTMRDGQVIMLWDNGNGGSSAKKTVTPFAGDSITESGDTGDPANTYVMRTADESLKLIARPSLNKWFVR